VKGSCGFKAIWEDGAGEKVTHSTILALALFNPLNKISADHAHISYDGSDA
jgi:hypothetical protein